MANISPQRPECKRKKRGVGCGGREKNVHGTKPAGNGSPQSNLEHCEQGRLDCPWGLSERVGKESEGSQSFHKWEANAEPEQYLLAAVTDI